MSAIKIETHIPFRLRALLTGSEQKRLNLAMDKFTPETEKIIALLESTVVRKHRIIRGSFFEGSFEYKDCSGEDQNVGVDHFIKSEFPGFMSDSGNVLPDEKEELPVEFIVTGNYSLALYKRPGRGATSGVRLLVRRGVVEMDFDIPEPLTSIADAILRAEKDNRWTAAFLKPISDEIVNCNLLGG